MALLTLSRDDARLVDLPTAWSNRERPEQLQRTAAESFSNLAALAVAKSGANFQLYDALRPIEEQIELLQRNYRRVTRGRYKSDDRSWDGSTWERRPGRPPTASPGWSKHGTGFAVDIHPGPIQEVFMAEGPAWGWSWEEGRSLGEPWHFVYVGGNRHASRGWLDHAWVQEVVGAEVDGKIGTGTVELIRAWQAERGLSADGIVGPVTKTAMLAGGELQPAPSPEYTVEHRPTQNRYEDRLDDGVQGELDCIVIHHWGALGQDFDSVVSWLQGDGNGNGDSSAHEVIAGERVAVLAPPEDATWSTGTHDGNLCTYSFELRPEADRQTLLTAAARIRALREATGKPLPLTVHQDYVNTACPGLWLQLLDTLDALAAGIDVPIPAVDSSTLPTGKELLVALIDAPDFPLLRTPGALCYYGPGDGPIESVSGKNDNSLHPGEVINDGAEGLRAWQAQMVERGYDLTVDGRYGPETAAACENLQQLAGIAQDQLIGPDAWHAAFLLPVQ